MTHITLLSERPLFAKTFRKLLLVLLQAESPFDAGANGASGSGAGVSDGDGNSDGDGDRDGDGYGVVAEAGAVCVDVVADPSALPADMRPELLLLDAGPNGADVVMPRLAECRRRLPDSAIVLVLDEPDDELTDIVMSEGAHGVMVKTAPPGVLAEWLRALLQGERVRPAPFLALDADALSVDLRARLSARRQKLLRLLLGGTSIAGIARQLGLTESRVVHETRIVMDIVRGR